MKTKAIYIQNNIQMKQGYIILYRLVCQSVSESPTQTDTISTLTPTFEKH